MFLKCQGNFCLCIPFLNHLNCLFGFDTLLQTQGQIIVWEEEKQLFWLTLKVSDKIICPWISKNCVGIKMFLKHSKEVGEGSVNLLEMKLHVLHVHVLPIKCHLSYD